MKLFHGKRFFAVVIALVLCVGLFAACGGKGDDRVTGTWKATHVEGMGVSVSLEEFTAMTGMEMEITFEFKSNGKVVGTVMGDSAEGSYKVDGDTVAVTFDGETENMTIEGDKLVLEMEGMKITMEK